jgi:WD40 repeat protein
MAMSPTVFSGHLVLSCVVVLTSCLRVWAAPAQEDKIAGTDAYGDLLPVGALSRLGSPRLSQLRIELLAISPDGKLVASAGAGARVFVWRIDSGKEARWFQAPMFKEADQWEVIPRVSVLMFSPDSKLLVLGCYNREKGAVLVWDVTTGKEILQFEVTSRPSCIAFPSDGKTLVAGLDSGQILFLDLAKGNQIDRWDGFSALRDITFSDEDKTIVSLGLAGRGAKYVTRIWDVAKGKEKALLEIDSNRPSPCALSSDGKTIAIPSEGGKALRFLNAATGKEFGSTQEKSESFTTCVFARDGSILAAKCRDGMIRMYDPATGKLRRQFRGHPMTEFDGDMALSTDGKIVATSSDLQDSAVHLWDVAEGKEMHTFVGHRGGPIRVAFLPDGKTVATVSRFSREGDSPPPRPDWSLRLWDAPTGKQGHVEKAPQEGRIYRTEFSYDGTRLVTVRDDGRLLVWDVAEGRVIGQWEAPSRDVGSNNIRSIALNFSSLAIAADGKTVATVGEREILRVWNAKTGEELLKKKLGTIDVANCLFSPDGKVLAVLAETDDRQAVLLLDAVDGQEIRRFPLFYKHALGRLAFSADGKELAVVTIDKVFVAEVASGKLRVEGTELASFSRGVALSPDGQILATAGADGVIRLWMAGAEKPISSLTGHIDEVDSLAFSPDGRMLASGGDGNVAYVWDVADILRGKFPGSVELGQKEFEVFWGDLASEDAAKAYKARNTLIAGAAQSVPWLQEKAKAFPPTDLSHLAESVKNLDSDAFETRMKAVDDLVHLGVWAGPTVRKAVDPESASESARGLAKGILDKLTSPPPEYLREVRTLEVLEHIGTPEAQKALEKIAEGKGPRQDEARACVERLRKRGVGKSNDGKGQR